MLIMKMIESKKSIKNANDDSSDNEIDDGHNDESSCSVGDDLQKRTRFWVRLCYADNRKEYYTSVYLSNTSFFRLGLWPLHQLQSTFLLVMSLLFLRHWRPVQISNIVIVMLLVERIIFLRTSKRGIGTTALMTHHFSHVVLYVNHDAKKHINRF